MRGKFGALAAATTAALSAVGATVWAKRRKEAKERDTHTSEAPRTPDKPETTALTTTEVGVPGVAPGVATPAASTAGGDDLTAIKGLGKVMAGRLHEAGVDTLAQIAAWTDEDISRVGMQINVSPGRIKREDWVGQAQARLES